MSNNPKTIDLVKSEVAAGVFVSTLASMQSGQVLQDLDDALRECTRASLASGKKGKVTLSLSIIPNGVGVGETPLFKIEEDIAVKAPKKGRPSSVFFADDDCNLTRRNHRQEEMRLTVVEARPDAPESAPRAAANR